MSSAQTRVAVNRRLQQAVRAAGGIQPMAEHSGVLLGTLKDYVDRRDQRLSFLVAFATASGVSLEWLATGFEQPSGDPKPLTDVQMVERFEAFAQGLALLCQMVDLEPKEEPAAGAVAMQREDYLGRCRVAHAQAERVKSTRDLASIASDEPSGIVPGFGDTESAPPSATLSRQTMDEISRLPVWSGRRPSAKQLAAFVAGLKAGEGNAQPDGVSSAQPFLGLAEASSLRSARRAFVQAAKQEMKTPRGDTTDQGRS